MELTDQAAAVIAGRQGRDLERRSSPAMESSSASAATAAFKRTIRPPTQRSTPSA
jgi:hypothetical protein